VTRRLAVSDDRWSASVLPQKILFLRARRPLHGVARARASANRVHLMHPQPAYAAAYQEPSRGGSASNAPQRFLEARVIEQRLPHPQPGVLDLFGSGCAFKWMICPRESPPAGW
jgi:hypothetical protein